jgi:superfamily II DNA helicase RecQ
VLLVSFRFHVYTPEASTTVPGAVPSFSEIRTHTEKYFGVRPCLWQIKVVDAVLKGDRDIASIARTGMGKTLTFWMPLLFQPPGSVQIIVTPLNILGKQNVSTLAKAGFKAIFISADTATAENFRVSLVVLMHKRGT